MSLCPPGSVFNPQTLRCVKAGGRLGKRLQTPALTRRQSNNYQSSYPRQSVPFTRVAPIPIYDAVPQFAQAITRSIRQSRIPILAPDLVRRRPDHGPIIFSSRPSLTQSTSSDPCPDGKILNPVTGKCVKVGGRVQRRIQRGPSNEAYDARAPMIYTRKASKIPISTHESMRNWISSQCANIEEPFTGKNLKAMTEEEMGSLIKTSAGTCLRAEYLDRHIRHERERGREVMDPLNPRRQLTLSNMDILGRTIRQVVPDYRVPQHTRRAMGDKLPTRGALPVPAATPAATLLRTRVAAAAPAPDLTQRTRIITTSYPENWKFFIGKDARSGNDFYSVYYYDKDMATVTNDGVKIPTQAIVIDIGIIPAFVGVVESGNPACTTSTLVEKLLALHKKQKLLHKLGNQLVATIELPGERARWKTPDGAIQRKFFQQVCQYLDELVK